jgi:hypothetical protein
MNQDFGISVAAEAIAPPHDQPDLHPLRITWIFDPSFRYTPSYATDLRKTFERIRRQLQDRVSFPPCDSGRQAALST